MGREGSREPSQALLLGLWVAGGGGCQVSWGFQGKVSSLGPRPAVAGRAIYFSAPKPLSHLFTQRGKELSSVSLPSTLPSPQPGHCRLSEGPPRSSRGSSGARITGPLGDIALKALTRILTGPEPRTACSLHPSFSPSGVLGLVGPDRFSRAAGYQPFTL